MKFRNPPQADYSTRKKVRGRETKIKTKKQEVHTPVLLSEVLQYLQPRPGESYLDLTAGMGGHAAAVLELTQAPSKAVLVDRDPAAVEGLEKKFKDSVVLQMDFLSAIKKLAEQGKKFDMILADLGVSSLHLDDSERGFSFMRPGPLDMRMDSSQLLNADEIVNRWDERRLAKLLSDYGQERKSRAIAARITANRPIHSTDQLAKLVASVYRFRSKIHPATRTFQALRIAVNDELAQIETSLPMMLKLLQPGGRLAIISFHSLEDRLVKHAFAEAAGQGYEAEIYLLNKKPITAQRNEIVFNPRARSAKMRAVAKIKT